MYQTAQTPSGKSRYPILCSCVYRIIRQSAQEVVPHIQQHISQTLAYKARFGKPLDRSASHAPLRSLVFHLSAAMPTALASIASDVARSLTSNSEADAVVAVDMLALFCSPEAKLGHSDAMHVLTCLLSASKAKEKPALRLKVTNVLPAVARSRGNDADTKRCSAALQARLKDETANVRTAALRSVSELAMQAALDEVPGILDKLLERLRDASEPVRLMVRPLLPATFCKICDWSVF